MSMFLQFSKFRFLTVLNVMAEGELLSYSFFFFFLATRSEVRKNIFLAVSLKLRVNRDELFFTWMLLYPVE